MPFATALEGGKTKEMKKVLRLVFLKLIKFNKTNKYFMIKTSKEKKKNDI